MCIDKRHLLKETDKGLKEKTEKLHQENMNIKGLEKIILARQMTESKTVLKQISEKVEFKENISRVKYGLHVIKTKQNKKNNETKTFISLCLPNIA